MQVRTGFVSNSSSSSFILYFPKGKPKDVEHMKQVLFGSEDSQKYVNIDDNLDRISTMLIAYTVFNEMKPTTKDSIAEALYGYELNLSIFGFYENPPSIDDPKYKVPAKKKIFKELEINHHAFDADRIAWAKRGAQVAIDFKKKNGGDIFKIECADDTTLGCHMEFGDIFRKIPHVRISHH